MQEEICQQPRKKILRKITPQRLKNIALYYLKRFDSSVENLRAVLRRRVNDYARQNKDWDKTEAYDWIEDILTSFTTCGYLNDERYSAYKIQNYINAGKSARYIQEKMRQKGIDSAVVNKFLDEYSYDSALAAEAFARKKRIGPYRVPEQRKDMYKKDMAALLRAGFNYDCVCEIMNRATDSETES